MILLFRSSHSGNIWLAVLDGHSKNNLEADGEGGEVKKYSERHTHMLLCPRLGSIDINSISNATYDSYGRVQL
jgi:hypothetical protein